VRRKDASKVWVARCEVKIGDMLEVLEEERAGIASPFGAAIGHADIAVACVRRFTSEVHPLFFNAARYPALSAHAAACEAPPAFAGIVRPLIPPRASVESISTSKLRSAAGMGRPRR
jgi:glutathione S-transferase